VTYAAGVTYLAPVTYAPTAQAAAEAAPVMLERVIVTPSRRYSEREWLVHLASRETTPRQFPVRSERRYEARGSKLLNVLLAQ
jgi:hypothetical protein